MLRHHAWLLAAACLACLTLNPPLPHLPASRPPAERPTGVADMGSLHDGKLRVSSHPHHRPPPAAACRHRRCAFIARS